MTTHNRQQLIERASRIPGGGSSQRIAWIDGARGLSIALMICSHVGLATGATPGWFHLYAMRPVAPMFLLLLGMLWRPGWRRRHWQLLAVAPLAQVLAWELGFATPNILAQILWLVVALHVGSRWPMPGMIVAVTQLHFWPPPDWWSGYEPGYVLAFGVAGTLVHGRNDGWLVGYGRVGSLLRLELVGRWPLTFYLGHLVVLAGASHLLEMTT